MFPLGYCLMLLCRLRLRGSPSRDDFYPCTDAAPCCSGLCAVDKDLPPALRLQKMAFTTRVLFQHARWVPHLTWPSTSTF